MEIKYNRANLRRSIYLGIAFLVIGFSSLFFSEEHFLAGFVGIGLFYIVLSLALRNRPYLILNDTHISIDGFRRKKIPIPEIVRVKYFAGDYIVKTINKEYNIDTNQIDKHDLQKATEYFERLIQAISSEAQRG